MADLRDALEAQFEAAEDGTLETPIEREIESNDDPIQAENRQASEETASEENRESRDEKGRFKGKEASSQDNPDPQPNDVGQTDVSNEELGEVRELQRPTTFKKEYLPIWEKMAKGQALTPQESIKFAEYAGNIRESEYKKGVSTYKAEADNARVLIDAIQPFVPELQKHGIHPATWIQNLGRAHYMLANGTQDQKEQMFQQLARDYGVQLPQGNYEQPQYADPNNYALIQELNALKSEVGQVRSWREQEENQRLMGEISRVAQDTANYPYFDEVREQMAQLLERGLAPDLQTAYTKAVRLSDDVWQKEQDRLLGQVKQQANKAQQVAKAKATAVSPRSVTPNGVVATSDKKDRKSLIESSFDTFTGNRF